jgi:hypothetical protein
MKGGTTSFHAYLGQSPGIEPPWEKEVRYFSDAYHQSRGWYRANFPLPSDRLTGEASPSYMSHPEAARRAAALVPDARLIALLRDPVQRAVSAYHHQVRMGREMLDLRDALDAEPSRIPGANWDVRENMGLTYGYRLRGRYADELRRWFDHYDRERVLVLPSERLFADPEGTTREACEWLGVEPPAALDVTPYNVGSYDDEVPGELRAELTDYYRPLNEELFDLLGQRFDWTT